MITETFFEQRLCAVCNGSGVKPVSGGFSSIPDCPACNGSGIQNVLVTRTIYDTETTGGNSTIEGMTWYPV